MNKKVSCSFFKHSDGFLKLILSKKKKTKVCLPTTHTQNKSCCWKLAWLCVNMEKNVRDLKWLAQLNCNCYWSFTWQFSWLLVAKHYGHHFSRWAVGSRPLFFHLVVLYDKIWTVQSSFNCAHARCQLDLSHRECTGISLKVVWQLRISVEISWCSDGWCCDQENIQ